MSSHLAAHTSPAAQPPGLRSPPDPPTIKSMTPVFVSPGVAQVNVLLQPGDLNGLSECFVVWQSAQVNLQAGPDSRGPRGSRACTPALLRMPCHPAACMHTCSLSACFAQCCGEFTCKEAPPLLGVQPRCVTPCLACVPPWRPAARLSGHSTSQLDRCGCMPRHHHMQCAWLGCRATGDKMCMFADASRFAGTMHAQPGQWTMTAVPLT